MKVKEYKNIKMPWVQLTDAIVDQITEFWLLNPELRYSDIADKFGLSRNQINGACTYNQKMAETVDAVGRMRAMLIREDYELMALGTMSIVDKTRTLVMIRTMSAYDDTYSQKTEISGPDGERIGVDIISHAAEQFTE
jgi:hypothetical protein